MSELFKSAMANTQIHRYRDADSFAKPEIVKVVFAELKKKGGSYIFQKATKRITLKMTGWRGKKCGAFLFDDSKAAGFRWV